MRRLRGQVPPPVSWPGKGIGRESGVHGKKLERAVAGQRVNTSTTGRRLLSHKTGVQALVCCR